MRGDYGDSVNCLAAAHVERCHLGEGGLQRKDLLACGTE